MASRVVMPKLSDTMEEGRILRWLRKEGESIETGQALAEVETDKATVEMESYGNGTILKLVTAEGQFVKVGDLIAIVGAAGEDVSALLPAAGAAPRLVAIAPRPSRAASAAAPCRRQRLAPRLPPPASPPAPTGRSLKASPLALRMAAEAGLDLGRLQGTGPQGRIIKRDIESALAQAPPAALGRGPAAEPRARSLAGAGRARGRPREPGRRAVDGAPHDRQAPRAEQGPGAALLPHHRRGDGSRVGGVQGAPRAEVADQHQRHRHQGGGARPAAASRDERVVRRRSREALLPRPHRHGRRDRGRPRSRRSCATPTSSPSRRSPDEARTLAERARARKLQPSEFTGATFSISNLGMMGIEEFSAIINPPEAAILAVGAVRQVPVVVDGAVTAGWRMKMTLSVDHRVADGAAGARFLQTLRKFLEHPLLMA